MSEQRLDVALAARGLARSRAHAAQLIGEGLVSIDGRPAAKSSAKVRDEQRLEVVGDDGWVSRAAHKLIGALDGFDVDPAGRVCLDLGASTGGFSQVLLRRGSTRVLAVDVGHGQLSPALAGEPALSLAEGVNARDLDRAALVGLFGADAVPTLVVADLSFISLRTVLPAIAACLGDGPSDAVLLVKPQFEVGRGGIREGIVRDPALRADALMDVLWTAHDLGLGVRGILSSPILGSSGNAEFLVHLAPGVGGDPQEWTSAAVRLAGA